MKRLSLLVFALTLTTACSYSGIEDGTEYNGLVTIEDMFTSAYLLPTSEGAVLFDAGFRSSRIESALEEQGVVPSDVTDVFITHGHGDHVAALELFSSADAHFVLGGQRHPDYQVCGGFRQMRIQNAGHHERLSQVAAGLSGAVSVSPGKTRSHV